MTYKIAIYDDSAEDQEYINCPDQAVGGVQRVSSDPVPIRFRRMHSVRIQL